MSYCSACVGFPAVPQALGVATTTHNRDVILNSDIIVLAAKPHQILGVMTEIQAMFSDFQSRAQPHISGPKCWRPLIVSVASSVTIADIEQKVCITSCALVTHYAMQEFQTTNLKFE